MLMHPVNELNLRVRLNAVSPLLIREGRLSDEWRKEMEPDDTKRAKMPMAVPVSRATEFELSSALKNSNPVDAVGKLPFYIPGSSLRGSWRSHLERTLRSLDAPEKPRICDPLLDDPDEDVIERPPNSSCSSVLTKLAQKAAKNRKTITPYRVSCPVCRLFGSTTQGSRLSVGDGERINPQQGAIIEREHVAIDRKLGSVKRGALLKHYALQGAIFRVNLRLRNFELQHIQLLGMLLTEVKRGLIPLGSGKNKGYGLVQGSIEAAELTCFGVEPDHVLRGVAEHPSWGDWFVNRYKLSKTPEPLPALPKEVPWTNESPWRHEMALPPDWFEEVWKEIKVQWSAVSMLDQRTAENAS
jgi:CRISPR/Cas system CSM-associated protein Csm3 (group 7 of RAMP superfamily)